MLKLKGRSVDRGQSVHDSEVSVKPVAIHLRISRMLLKKIRLLEFILHDDRQNNREWLERLLPPEFLDITRSSVMVDRSETITSLLNEKIALPIVSSDFRLTEMEGGCAMLHYRTSYAACSRPALRSPYWLHSDSWLCFFTKERQLQALLRSAAEMLYLMSLLKATL